MTIQTKAKSTRPQMIGECEHHFSRVDGDPWHICPLLSCRYNFALEITRRGALRINPRLMRKADDGGIEHTADGSTPSCMQEAIGRRGRHTLEEVGKTFGLSRERVRQIEAKAAQRIAANASGVLLDLLGLRKTRSGAIVVHDGLPELDGADPRELDVVIASPSSVRLKNKKHPQSSAIRYQPTTPWAEINEGHRLRRIRCRLGWRLDDLAEAVGVARSHIREMENNRSPVKGREVPILEYLQMPANSLRRRSMPMLRHGLRSDREASRVGGGSIIRIDWLLGIEQRTQCQSIELTRRLHSMTIQDMGAHLDLTPTRYRETEQDGRVISAYTWLKYKTLLSTLGVEEGEGAGR